VLGAIAASLLHVYWRQLCKVLRSAAVYAERVSFRAKLRNAISFLQIVTQLGPVYALRFPAAYARLLDVISIANLHLFTWLPGLQPVCVGLGSLESQLWFAALAPLGIALAAFPVAKLAGRSAIDALPFVLGWTFLLFPSLASRGFRALAPCDAFPYAEEGGAISFLREDYAVECTGSLFGRPSAPSAVRTPAWVAIALWAAGVPLLYTVLLRNATRLRGSLGLLIGDYRPEAKAWELVPVVEKLVLVGFLSLFHPGQLSQIFIGVLFALCAFMLQARVAPYRCAGDRYRRAASNSGPPLLCRRIMPFLPPLFADSQLLRLLELGDACARAPGLTCTTVGGHGRRVCDRCALHRHTHGVVVRPLRVRV
jgi:hypothetical protein